jgi:hypothetical protein
VKRRWLGWTSLALAGLAAAWIAERFLAPPYDPLARARIRERIGNIEAGIPAQCYAKTGPHNGCYVCHAPQQGLNRAQDIELQSRYDFSPARRDNYWTNLFVDRSADIAAQSDADILRWVRSDNYDSLRKAVAGSKTIRGWRPDVDLTAGFGPDGFARDGSHWRAFRYKPFPGAFWPTNGSADEVMIRLPAPFRENADGQYADAIYRANLAIVEALIATPDNVADDALDRPIEAIDETAAGLDLDGNGVLEPGATRLRGLPSRFAGRASEVPRRYVYPQGTEFLHTVRYLDPDAPDFAARRLKELRHSVKEIAIDNVSIEQHYAEDAREKAVGGRPHYAGNALTGQSNDFGWTLTGYIEDAEGRLRLQTREEQLFCMGCHTGAGISVDQSFALPRKQPAAAGWGLQSLQGQFDIPQQGHAQGDVVEYLQRVGGGDDYRANREMLERFFRDGRLDLDAAEAAQAQGLQALLLPSRGRALALDKAYRSLVREQSFQRGRDAVLSPISGAHLSVEQGDPAPAAADTRYEDARPWLAWPELANHQ